MDVLCKIETCLASCAPKGVIFSPRVTKEAQDGEAHLSWDPSTLPKLAKPVEWAATAK